jgi:hypothetical protein
VNLGKSIERSASHSAGYLISLVDNVVHAGRNALIVRAELHYMTNALLNSMSKSVSTDGSVLRNTGVHLTWNLPRQNTTAAASELAGNKLVRLQNICCMLVGGL